jgi:hypothetical protein
VRSGISGINPQFDWNRGHVIAKPGLEFATEEVFFLFREPETYMRMFDLRRFNKQSNVEKYSAPNEKLMNMKTRNSKYVTTLENARGYTKKN